MRVALISSFALVAVLGCRRDPPPPVAQMPGTVPGAMPGQMPGQMPGMMPGQMPGQMPGMMPGQMPGQMPGAMPGMMPGAMPGVPGMLAVGATQAGALQMGDTVLANEGGRLGDDYQLMLNAGMPITITTIGGPSTAHPGQTLDVVTALICNGAQVARDDDGAGYPNSRIQYTPVMTGACTVRVMGFAGDQGSYTVSVAPGATAGAAMGMPTAMPGAMPMAMPGMPAGALALGGIQQGVLMPGDSMVDGRLSDDYQMMLTAGMPVTIITRGGARTNGAGTMDVITALICNGQQMARDDDGAGYPNSRIIYTPMATGMCTVRVMGFAGSQGAYTVQTYPGALPSQT